MVPRKIEINRQSAAKEAIGKLVRQGILERVPNDVVTDWISPCSFVSKDGKKLRLVVDFRGLNKYVKPSSPVSVGNGNCIENTL